MRRRDRVSGSGVASKDGCSPLHRRCPYQSAPDCSCRNQGAPGASPARATVPIIEQLDSYSVGVATQTRRRPATHRLIPAVPLTVATLWLAWVSAPPWLIPYHGFWFDFGVVPAAVLIALLFHVLAMWQGLAPRNALAWVGLVALCLILALQGFVLRIVLTFPTNF